MLIALIDRIKIWWNANRARISHSIVTGANRVERGMFRISRNVGRLILMGIIVNIIASNFYPEFPKRFPTIYAWFDGWLQFGEFALKAGLGFIYAFFKGNSINFWAEYDNAFKEMLSQFVRWLSTIHF